MRQTLDERAALAPAELERWESWPLWAIGLSNGLNIALWFVLSMVRVQAPELAMHLPALVDLAMPWLIVAGAVSSALSLDGVLIATIAGVRHGRKSLWSYATIAGAGLFSALIAYAVHAGQLQRWSWLHVAQAIVLVLYNLHLSQPKGLTGAGGSALPLFAGKSALADYAVARPAEPQVAPQVDYPLPVMTDLTDGGRLARCRHCGEMIPRGQLGPHGRNVARFGHCVRL